VLPQDDLSLTERFIEIKGMVNAIAFCYKANTICIAAHNVLILWSALSKFSIVPRITTRERHLTEGKLYQVRPMLPPPQQSLSRSRPRSAREPDHSSRTSKTT